MNHVLKIQRSKTALLVWAMTLSALLLNACAPAITPQPPIQAPPATDENRLMNPLPDLWSPREGEVPAELIEAVRDDLALQSGASSDQIEVIRAEAVTYDDGSLGCPKPEEMYIMAQVEGYRVVLYLNEIEFDYRISDTGNFVLCDLPQP